ncbi:PREDICTED: alpha-tocopherol transfer protein-like [Papilio xuthus]|uniref:Alpha-tocopherol transfer protein-like n=1 Tax=Papilio xuthus TaxID=66420 RepID=A0AAJ6ZTS7_PAPXU|nr:PREDICTED: alpha-tocopherol transfer protein-like [Papilio xuthus]
MQSANVLLTVSTTLGTGDEKREDDIMSHTPGDFMAVAARELRETSSIREQALSIMREWIQKNHDIRNVRQDDNFLLRFLRHKKYSIPMAQQTLLKYLSLRKYYPECFTNLDCDEPNVAELLNSGYIVVSPVRDNKGRRVIVYNMSKFNANKFTCWDMCRVHIVVYESLLDDPVDQVMGFTHVGEGSGVTAAHITAWNPTDFGRMLKWGEQSVPMRHKDFHLVNIPSALKYIIDFAVSKVSSKMAQRLNIHTHLKQLHKNLSVTCLPTSYGGPLQLQDMISYTRQLLSCQKKKLLALDDMEILSTRGITSSRNRPVIKDGTVSIEGSFRKLDID